MKRTLLSILCLAIALVAQAQQWAAPAVPAEDVNDLEDTDVVYIYNVKADAFVMYGLASNTQACATRLTDCPRVFTSGMVRRLWSSNPTMN